MKIVVISDSHGNIANLKHVLGFARKIKAGAIIHCGDWNNIEAVETVLRCRIPVYGVNGNADIDDVMKSKFKDFLKLKIDGKKIGVMHNLTISHQALVIGCDVVFCGHKHRQQEYMQGGVKIVNPGALENNISFAIYDTDTNKVEFLGI